MALLYYDTMFLKFIATSAFIDDVGDLPLRIQQLLILPLIFCFRLI